VGTRETLYRPKSSSLPYTTKHHERILEAFLFRDAIFKKTDIEEFLATWNEFKDAIERIKGLV